jgi:hypothetical protein
LFKLFDTRAVLTHTKLGQETGIQFALSNINIVVRPYTIVKQSRGNLTCLYLKISYFATTEVGQPVTRLLGHNVTNEYFISTTKDRKTTKVNNIIEVLTESLENLIQANMACISSNSCADVKTFNVGSTVDYDIMNADRYTLHEEYGLTVPANATSVVRIIIRYTLNDDETVELLNKFGIKTFQSASDSNIVYFDAFMIFSNDPTIWSLSIEKCSPELREHERLPANSLTSKQWEERKRKSKDYSSKQAQSNQGKPNQVQGKQSQGQGKQNQWQQSQGKQNQWQQNQGKTTYIGNGAGKKK